MANRYVSSVTYAAVTQWAAATAYNVGDLRRQLAAPTFGNERVFRCTTAGTSGAAEPTWVLTAGATTADGSVVWTEVTSNTTYNSWAYPLANLLSAINLASAGDVYYVAHDHAEVKASGGLTLTFKGTSAAPDRILCVNRAGSVPPVAADLATTGVVTSSDAGAAFVVNGYFYAYGLTWVCGSGSAYTALIQGDNSQSHRQNYEKCVFKLGGTSGQSISLGQYSSKAHLNWTDCQLYFQAANCTIYPDTSGSFTWRNSASVPAFASGSAAPTTVMAGSRSLFKFSGLDLTGMSATGTIMNGDGAGNVLFANCKTPSSATFCSGQTLVNSGYVDFIGCASGALLRSDNRYHTTANLTTETTIVRTGGASDGATAFSWKLVGSTYNRRETPFETFEGGIYNTVVGTAKTLTVHCVTDNVTLLDSEVWLEVEYLGTAGSTASTRITDAAATILTTGAAKPSSTQPWNTTGLTTPVKQQMSVTFTPQVAGPIRWRVKFAKPSPSATVYVCPKAELV